VDFTRQHPASTGFHLPAMVPSQVKKFDNDLFVSLLDSGNFVSVSEDGCLRQSFTPACGSTITQKVFPLHGTVTWFTCYNSNNRAFKKFKQEYMNYSYYTVCILKSQEQSLNFY